MSPALEIHDTLARNGAMSSAPFHDSPVIDPEGVMKPTPQIFKIVRRVIVHWSPNPPFHPAIQAAAKTNWRGPRATPDTGRACVINRINKLCQFTSH